MSKTTKIVLIIAAAVVVLGLAALAAFTDFDAKEYIGEAVSGIGGLIVGFGFGKKRKQEVVNYHIRGGGSAAALLLAVTLSAGCAGYTPPDNACETEGTIVGMLDAGLTAADGVVGDAGGEEWDTIRLAARGAAQLGAQAIRACELARDDAGWQQWVGLALETAAAVAAFIDGAGPEDIEGDSPPELHRAIEMLQMELARPSPSTAP